MVLSLITLYKRFISPVTHFLGQSLFGSHFACRFTPTCSEYSHQSIKQYGIITGVRMSALRILRCNPLFQGGLDPVPTRSTELTDKIK